MRRYLSLLVVACVSASLLVAGPAASAASVTSDAPVTAAYNKKKCKKAKTKKAKRKYCKRSQGQGQG